MMKTIKVFLKDDSQRMVKVNDLYPVHKILQTIAKKLTLRRYAAFGLYSLAESKEKQGVCMCLYVLFIVR